MTSHNKAKEEFLKMVEELLPAKFYRVQHKLKYLITSENPRNTLAYIRGTLDMAKCYGDDVRLVVALLKLQELVISITQKLE